MTRFQTERHPAELITVRIRTMDLLSKRHKEQANDQKVQETKETKTTYIEGSTRDAGDPTEIELGSPTPTEAQAGSPTPTEIQTDSN